LPRKAFNVLAINKEHKMKDNLNTEINRDAAMSQVSMKNGYWFYFEHAGNDISMHGSAWSGKETMYVNNHPVSMQRKLFGRLSQHYFTVGDIQYRAEVYLAKFATGEVQVSLYADDVLVAKESKAYLPNAKQKPSIWVIIFAALLGGVVGYSAVKLLFALLG
jgi:hypothetical protein